MKQLIKDALTGEEIITDFTPEELAQKEIDKEDAKIRKAEVAAKEKQRKAILDRLGLTADELQTILG